jgi:hypothetical protein
MLTALQSDMVIGQLQALPIHQLRQWVWAIMTGQYLSNLEAQTFDLTLLKAPRNEQQRLRKRLKPPQRANLELLKMAPIIVNWDSTDSHHTLAAARLGRRGVNDHAMTLFRTSDSMIFEQSHIFFDGVWGLAVAEILTHEALSWASYLISLPAVLNGKPIAQPAASISIPVSAESAVESDLADLAAMLQSRRNLRERLRDIAFTINDLLILYRTIFNQQYQPSSNLKQTVAKQFATTHPKQAEAIQQMWQKLPTVNPALLIPMDAVDGPPRDRLYPISFRNPFLEFLESFSNTYNALQEYRNNRSSAAWATFNQLRLKLVNEFYYFGKIILAHKQLALTGESTNLATLKLLGHLPDMVQSVLGKMPQKFDFLNEMLMGEEVFSNLGRVATGTSPVRFMSARDDNDAKALVWGVLTDDQDVMHIALRDFRPEVTALIDLDQADLAHEITKDFLDGYINGLNQFVAQLNDMMAATLEETE